MTNPNAFTRLCDLTDDLLAQVRALPDSPQRAMLFQVVDAFDALIDALVGIDLLALAREGEEERDGDVPLV